MQVIDFGSRFLMVLIDASQTVQGQVDYLDAVVGVHELLDETLPHGHRVSFMEL